MSDVALDATAQAITRQLLGSHPADRPRGRAEVDALPAPVAHRVHAVVDAHLAEAAAPPESPWVDASAPDLLAAADAWLDAAAEAAQIPAEAWEDLLGRAVRGALDHLVYPAPTLAAHAFAGEAESGGDLPTSLVIARTRAVSAYPYLPDIAAQYADRKGAERIDQAGLERLLRQIDQRVTDLFRADEWAALFAPLFEVAGGALPGPVLHDALAARGAHDLAARFEASDLVSPEAFREGVEETLPPLDEPAADGDPEEPAPPEADGAPELTSVEAAPPEMGGEPDDMAADDVAPDVEDAADEPESTDPDATEGGADEPSSDDLAEPDAEVESEPADDGIAPPVIGSKWQSVEETFEDDSAVLGGPRPAALPSEDEEPDAAGTDSVEPYAPPAVTDVDLPAPEEDVADPAPDAVDAPVTEEVAFAEGSFVFPADEPADDAPGGVETVAADETAAVDLEMPEAAPVAPLLPIEEPAPEDATTDGDLDPEEPAESPQNTVDDPAAESEPSDEPLWRRIARQQGVEVVESEPTADADPGGAAPLWQRFAEPTASLARPAPTPPPLSGSLDDVERRVLGETPGDRRAWFVGELFGGAAEDYHRTLLALDGTRSWTEATQVIARDVFQKHRVNIYSDPAIAFTDAVEANAASG